MVNVPGPLKCLFKHCERVVLLLPYFIVCSSFTLFYCFTKLLQQPPNHIAVDFPFTLRFLYSTEIKPHSSRYYTRPYTTCIYCHCTCCHSQPLLLLVPTTAASHRQVCFFFIFFSFFFLFSLNLWDVVPCPPSTKPLGNKFVFSINFVRMDQLIITKLGWLCWAINKSMDLTMIRSSHR